VALGTPVAAAAAYSASAGTTVAPAYPAGILASDVVLLFVGQKPTTTTGGTVTTPSGWTLRDELTGAGGYTAQGADTGNTNLRVYSWNTPVAGQTGTLTVTIGGNDVTWAFMVRIPKGAGAAEFGSADGQRTTTPTSPMSIALTNGATATNFQTGDRAIWAMCIPTDVQTPSQFSAQSITATGATFGTATELNEPDSQTGNDIGGYSAWAAVTAGSSTTAPTVTATLAGTLTNVRGPVVLLRVREAALAPVTGTLAATETGADTFAATGDVHVKGSLAASEAGADTFAATGTVTDQAIAGTMAASEAGADTFSAAGDVIVKGALAATEAGADTLAAAGKVLVRGTLAATEAGADTFAATGDVIVRGALAASETGADTLAATGKVIVKGSLAASESGADTFAALGDVIVKGALAATEAGSDTLAAAGKVVVQGSAAAAETGADTFAAAGSGVVQALGTLAATETGTDALAATGSVRVQGSAAAAETGADSLAASGTVRVQGSAAAAETGIDTLAANGRVQVAGALAATEAGTDTLAASGSVRVAGALAATEAGSDIFSASGAGQTQGALDASEAGADTFSGSGALSFSPRTGTLAATEAADTFGGYVAPGYVEPGYVTGVDGTLGTTWALSGAQVLLLRQVWQLHGLGAPLTVAASTRSTADITQTIAQAGQAVTVSTTAASQTFSGNPGQMIEELAALHGITAPLTVTPTSRIAGTIVQSLATVGSVTTVTRQ